MGKFLLILSIMFVHHISVPAQSSRQLKSVSYNAQSKSIIVPFKDEKTIVSDGIFSKREWDGAAEFPISASCKIYLLADSENLYIGLKIMKTYHAAVSEIYLTDNGTEFYNLHASGSPAEGINTFSKDLRSAKFSVNNNKDWTVNATRERNVKFEGKEYIISLKKFKGNQLKMAGSMLIIINETGTEREKATYPDDFGFQNNNDWVELILPSNN